MPKNSKPWKQSFRRLSKKLLEDAERFGPEIKVGVVKRVGAADIAEGTYEHLALKLLEDGSLEIDPSVIPPEEIGRFSCRNVGGWRETHRDQPKIWDTIYGEAPDWGGYGMHSTSWDIERYPYTDHAPRYARIEIELLAQEINGDFNIRFTVEEVLETTSDSFADDLLMLGNLLQENVGSVGVMSASASLDDYLSTIHLNWEILPPGETDRVIQLVADRGRHDHETRQRLSHRIRVLERLGPTNWAVGTGGLQRYFGATFAENVVAFENEYYGNAIYVLGEDWEAVSPRSRIDLISSSDDVDFTRIVHNAGWEEELQAEIYERLNR